MDTAHKVNRALAAALVACGLVGCGSAAQGATRAAVEPARHIYVGSLNARPAAKIALLTADHSALAYLCDNAQLADLFHGTAHAGIASVDDGDGATLTAAFSGVGADGTVSLPGQAPARFHATPVTGPAGLYEANATSPTGALSGRWVVAVDGTSAGALRLNRTIVANPAFASTVTAGVVSLHPVARLGVPLTAVTTPPPAAPQRHLWAYGQGGGAIVYGDNFVPGAVVRVELLDAGLQTVLAQQYLHTISTGAFDVLMSTSTGYAGAVWVSADSPGGSTVWTKTYVFAAPHLDSIVGSPCGTVAVKGSGFYPGATVRVELLDTGFNVIDTEWATAQFDRIFAGTIRATLVSNGYVGKVLVAADFGGPGEAAGEAFACRT